MLYLFLLVGWSKYCLKHRLLNLYSSDYFPIILLFLSFVILPTLLITLTFLTLFVSFFPPLFPPPLLFFLFTREVIHMLHHLMGLLLFLKILTSLFKMVPFGFPFIVFFLLSNHLFRLSSFVCDFMEKILLLWLCFLPLTRLFPFSSSLLLPLPFLLNPNQSKKKKKK